jgi:hypothetical protein
MRQVNRGKDFEKCIKESLVNLPNVSFDRLPDPMAGYSGIRNICDFSMFCSPDMFYLECKSHYGNTLNYASDITKNQWDGMLEKSRIYRCIAGVCVWYIDYDLTVFVNIRDLNEHRKSGAKSLNISDITGDNCVNHFIIDGIKKKVMFKYFGESFLNKLHKQASEIWGEFGANK